MTSSSPANKADDQENYQNNLESFSSIFSNTGSEQVNLFTPQRQKPQQQTVSPQFISPKRSSSVFEQRFQSSRPINRIFSPSAQDQQLGVGRGSPSKSPASSRAARHRELFLNRVKHDRDTDRYNQRGEQLLMLEHINEQRQWVEKMRRSADNVFREYRLEELDPEQIEEDDDSNQINPDESMLDRDYDLTPPEDPEVQLPERGAGQLTTSTFVERDEQESLYSDGVDYDEIFLNLINGKQDSISGDVDMSG
ncbi:hypothetical protein VTN31DRAFT_5524 [Thermomyces dupontii]|uniref:uncharacterized protein n=1 Tax=Talaromyces thermophilus TaxID=28565 RepID=UPI0037437DAB